MDKIIKFESADSLPHRVSDVCGVNKLAVSRKATLELQK